MEFQREKPDCKFEVPEKITVRMQLAYYSAASSIEQDKLLERSWEAAKQIIIPASWRCELVKLDSDLDELTDPQATDIILWAGMRVRDCMNELERIPKN
jgi:hypothetical protein